MNFDNAVFRAINKFVDCICVSLLWLVCCIPVFTIGASSSALYYTVHKTIRGGREYVMRSFFRSFRESFKQSTLSWLIMLVVDIVLVCDAMITYQVLHAGSKMGAFFYVFLVAIALVVGWGCVMFAYIARFANTVRATLKNSLLIAVANLPWTLLLLVITVAAVLAVYLIPFLIFIMPAVEALLSEMILERIFRRYMSDEDRQREIEIEQMDQKNR